MHDVGKRCAVETIFSDLKIKKYARICITRISIIAGSGNKAGSRKIFINGDKLLIRANEQLFSWLV